MNTDTDDRLLAAIDSASASAYGGDIDGGELSRQRALALDAYAGKNFEPAQEGRSQVVDWTVFETVQWVLPSLCRIFAADADVVALEPMGPEDEDAAEQESAYLNYMVTQKNNWFLTFMEWAQDALVTKNAYCYAYMQEKITPEIERYEGQSQEQVAMLLEDGAEIVGQDIREEGEPKPVTDPNGQPVLDELGQPMLEPNLVFDVEIRRVKTKQKLCLQVLPPENVMVGAGTPDFTLDECDYFEYRDRTTISDLRKEGYDVDDDIMDDLDDESAESDSRDEMYGDRLDEESTDRSMRRVTARHIWIRHDTDEDGIAELQYVLLVGREVLLTESCSRIPVACIVPILNTHRHIGMSVADLVFDIQRIKTALLRQGLDSLYLSTNPRNQVSDKVNLDDMLVNRPGALVRLKEGAVPGEGHIMPLTTEFIFPQAQEGLRHMDTVVESRVGVNRMFQGLDESGQNDHNRIGQLSTMASQRVEQIARLFANGVERLFSICHELIIKSGHQAETVRLRGQWVQINPSEWSTGRDMKVVAPFAAGNKDSLIQRLMLFGSIHEKALAGGLSIVDEKNAYYLAREIAKACDLMPDKLLTDPETVPPKEPPPDYTMMALEIEGQKVQQSQASDELDAETKRAMAELDAELEKYKIDTNAELQLILAKIKEGGMVNVEKLRATLKHSPELGESSTAALQQAFENKIDEATQLQAALQEAAGRISDLQDEVDGPREVVREGGKIVGVKINGKLRKVKRDSTGKVVGI